MACSVQELPTILRIASIAIALYEYIWTLPHEARLLARGVASRPFLLFFYNRYIAIATVAVSNVGFLLGGFSEEACGRFFWAAPTLEVFACLAAQLIVAIRTYGLSRKAPWVKWTMACALLACFVVQMFVDVYKRVPLQDEHLNCTSGSRIAWVHYLAALAFDLLALGVACAFVLRHAPQPLRVGCGLTSFPRALFEQGALYYVGLALINATNLAFFRLDGPPLQSSAASLGYVVTWIMAQRILIDCSHFFAASCSGGDGLFIAPRPGGDYAQKPRHSALPTSPAGVFASFKESFRGELSMPSEDEIEGWKRPGAVLGGDGHGVHVQVDVENDRRMSEMLGCAYRWPQEASADEKV